MDLAVWVNRLDDLKAVQRARVEALKKLAAQRGITFAHHQVEVFLMDPETGRYLGRLCCFRHCPAEKPPCPVPGCGAHQRMKVARWLMGKFASPHFRRPIRPLSDAQVQAIREGLTAIGFPVVQEDHRESDLSLPRKGEFIH